MKVSIITDELSTDLDTALELAADLGVDGVELRGVGEGRFPDVSPDTARLVPRLLQEYGLPVVAMSPGLLKVDHVDPDRPIAFLSTMERARSGSERASADRLEQQLHDLLPRAITAAQTVGCPMISCFSLTPADEGLRRLVGAGPGSITGVAEILRAAATTVRSAGLRLTIENDGTGFAGDAASTRRLVEAVGPDLIGVTWDPANALLGPKAQGDADDIEQIAEYVEHVHFKNVRRSAPSGSLAFDVEGVIDWERQLGVLQARGYDGYVSIETHMRPRLARSRTLMRHLTATLAALHV